MLGTWAGPSRHRPLTILDDGRATERLAKAQGPTDAAAACHRIVKCRGTLAGCAYTTAEEYSILRPSNGTRLSGKVSIRSRVDDGSGGTGPHHLRGTKKCCALQQKCLIKTKEDDQCSYRLKDASH